MTNGELQVCKDLTIVGPGATNLTLSGNYSNRVFSVCTNTTLNLSDLTVANGFSTNGGGIYNNGGTLNLTGCTLCSNRAAVVTTDMSQPVPFAPKGGAIYSLGSITAVNCLFCANSAQAEGPGHFAMGPGDTVSGGAVCNLGTLQSTGCLFQANQVVGVTAAWGPGGEADGGAVFNSSTAAYLAWNCTYTGNSAVGGVNMLTGPGGNGLGGAICGGGQLILGSVTFVANQASGGVYVDYPTGTGNAGGVGMGGAIYGAAQVCNGTFATNQAVGGQGGAGNLGGERWEK